MTLLGQLEHEREHVQRQLKRLTREHAVLTEQITRLRTGAPPEIVYAALRVSLGGPDLHRLASQGAEPEEPTLSGDFFPSYQDRPGYRTQR